MVAVLEHFAAMNQTNSSTRNQPMDRAFTNSFMKCSQLLNNTVHLKNKYILVCAEGNNLRWARP